MVKEEVKMLKDLETQENQIDGFQKKVVQIGELSDRAREPSG
jgi:hypothetical protein